MDENTGLFQNPILRKLAWLGGFLLIYLGIGFVMWHFDPATNHDLEVIADVVFFVVGMVVWLMFFAQFVLPVTKIQDRGKVIDRLVTYLMGGHGPAIFIENGFIRSHEKETGRGGPGVIWLDSASAAVLRTAVELKGAIGPGVHFTNGDEYIAATADLHTLSQSIGPNDTEQPFKNYEDEPDYKELVAREKDTWGSSLHEAAENALQKRKDEIKAIRERAESTSALTRDGIIVCASLSVSFRLKSTAGEGSTRFGFNRENSLKAIRDSMVREANLDHPVWNSLPARMAADIWREYLGKFRFSELFEVRGNRSATTIEFIADMIKKRLTREHIEALNEYGQFVLANPEREKDYLQFLKDKNFAAAENLLRSAQSTEFLKLSEMGLEVKSVSIKKLYFAADIEALLINQWKALWLANAQRERQQVENERNSAETAGKQDGLKNFALSASQLLSRQQTQSQAEALELLMRSVLQNVQRNPALFTNITVEERRDLSEIISWLRLMQRPVE